MNEEEIANYITRHFAHVRTDEAWGTTFFFYNPNPDTPDELYFATLKAQDDDYDASSQLDRPGVFRLSIGVSKDTFRKLFDDDAKHDFAALDQLLPHPVYGHVNWLCIQNPSARTLEAVLPLLEEFMSSRGLSEQAACLVAVTRIRHAHPDLR